MITRMDASIGALMARLDDPNGDSNNSDSILNNTLVIFTSDNGPTVDDGSQADLDFFDANGQYRGGKFEVYEGGIHMPGIAYWHGTIAAGYVNQLPHRPRRLHGDRRRPGRRRNACRHRRHVNRPDPHRRRPHAASAITWCSSIRAPTAPIRETRIGRWTVIRQDGKKLIRYDNETSALVRPRSPIRRKLRRSAWLPMRHLWQS